ncbi:MAG: DUF6318 family protein [Nocardioides sp.]
MSVAHGIRGLRGPLLLRLAAGACAVVLVAGCTSNAEPSPLPEPSASSSATASPSAAPPTMPPEADGTSPKAAKAFAHHYFDVINYAARTGDTEGLRELGTKDCVSCEAIASNVEKIYNAGGHIESEGWRLDVVTPVPAQPSDRPILDLGVVQSPEKVIERAGAREKSYPGGKKPMTMYLIRVGASWKADRIDEVRS